MHRREGVPLVVWQDGRVVEISADDVELSPEPADVAARTFEAAFNASPARLGKAAVAAATPRDAKPRRAAKT